MILTDYSSSHMASHRFLHQLSMQTRRPGFLTEKQKHLPGLFTITCEIVSILKYYLFILLQSAVYSFGFTGTSVWMSDVKSVDKEKPPPVILPSLPAEELKGRKKTNPQSQ